MGKGQELLDAAREGDRKTVEKILGQITKRSGPFTSLRRGAGVNVQDDNGYTPLHHACLRGHREIVRLLLSVDASPCVVDKKHATPLHLAAWKGDSDVVAMLLAHTTPSVNIDHPTTDHETALIIAAQFGNVDVVAQLLSRGADVTVRNIKNETALDLAAQYGRLETVQHLLRARPQLVDDYRFPVCRGRVFPSTPLHRASKNGHKEVVSTLIAAGMDANVRTNNGTALHEAANYGKASVVRVLLAKGADLNAFDRRGKTVHDLLNEYSEEATKRVRRIIREHMATNGYESEEDLPPFPTQDYSPTGYSNTVGMKAPETQEIITNKSLSSSSSILTKHPSNFVKRLANKLGLKGRFSSAPNISNTENDAAVKSKYAKRSSTNTVSIGNSKFFHMLSKKEDTGEVVCNDEFDTISLDRVGTLERSSTVNRSNRSCPGFKTSLPNIAENVELSDSSDSLSDSVVITEIDPELEGDFDLKPKKPIEAVNTNSKLRIFEPRDDNNSNPRSSTGSTNVINECYESYEIPVPVKTKTVNLIDDVDLIPKPPPRPERKISNDGVIYENINIKPSIVPIPAARVNVPKLEENRINYENVTPLPRRKPEPPKRTLVPRKASPEPVTIDSSPSVSRTSTMSSDSMLDEANFEDILLSKKSTSFKHRRVATNYSLKAQSSQSIASDSSEASALDNVDVSAEFDEKSMYLSMTGTLPNKKPERAVKKKVLFRHKTFTNIEVDPKNNFPNNNNELKKETLANYHIKGTGHCIYKAPTVQEFIEVFNRDTLYSDVEPFQKVPRTRDSYIETTICFCKPKAKKFYKSAEDLLAITQDEEKVTIDVDALRNSHELSTTSFQCFCDKDNCTFHAKNREAPVSLVVKFSAIKKSISTPDITLDPSPVSTTNKPLIKNKSVPYKLEEPYAVLDLKDIVSRQWSNNSDIKDTSLTYSTMSNPSSMSTCSRPYSIKDISDVISNKDTNSLSSDACDVRTYAQQKSASEHSGHWSLHTCSSNATVKSDVSFKSCLEEQYSSDDGTLNSEDDSETDTIKSEVDRGWVHSDSFRVKRDVIVEEGETVESGIEMSPVDKSCENVPGLVGVALLERGSVRSGSGRRRWDEEGTSEGDALSVSSAASSCAPHLTHHHDYNKVSPTPPKKPPRRNLSVSPTHVNSPSSGYSYELRAHARSQDDLDDLQGTKHYLKHGRSIDQYVDGKLSYSEYEEYDNSPRIAPIPNPRTKPRTQPVAITAMYENVVIKEQNPRRKLKRNSFGPQNENFDSKKYTTQERSSMESLLDDSMNSPSDCERYYEGSRGEIPLSPSHYEPPPTPDHPPPSARQAENSIHERIRPLSQEYKRRSAQRDSYTEIESSFLRATSSASVASGATDRSGNTDCVEEYVCDVPFAGLFKGSTTTLDGIGLRPVPAERPKTLRKLKSVYDTSPTEPPVSNYAYNTSNGQGAAADRLNGADEEVRRRSNTTSSNHSADTKSLSILSPFDEQEEWAKISEIMASFGSKLVRESVFVTELEQEFASRLGLSCSNSSLSPSVTSSLSLWLTSMGLHDYEPLFLDSGFDDVDFINGVLEDSDLKEMGIEEADRQKILESAKQLPNKIAEISNNNNNVTVKSRSDSVEQWLKTINLDKYIETFKRHLYIDMDRVKRIWEVELTAVLEIQKSGHRKRILASVSSHQNGPVTNVDVYSADLNNVKNTTHHPKEERHERMSDNLKAVPPPVVPTLAPPGGETLKRSKKNRPAPQPPRPSDLEIRAPSELLVGVPGALKTQWKHQPFVLVTGSVTYVANYLGSTVVKELRGTESTKKSIQKLKKSTKEPRDSPDIILSISYRGVKFLNTITRELICEHEIRNIHCACQDADDLTHFAYITKDHSTKSHYCHVFCVATMDQATEVILTLGEAFEVAYQMALREQSNRVRVTQSQAKTPTHDPMTTSNKEKANLNHGRSHSITEIKLNGHQLKIAPIPSSLSTEDFQNTRATEGSKSPRTPLLKAPIASTEEL